MDRTRIYFEHARDYRAKLRGIWEEYGKAEKELEPYKGSAGYNNDVAEAAKTRDAAITSLQNEYREKFDVVLKGMRQSATSRPMTAPTPEQLALLQALKMRETISRDELEQAGRTLKDSSVCLSVLDEIAMRQGYAGLRFGGESTAAILAHVDELTASAKKLCALNKPDSRREMVARKSIYSVDRDDNAMYSFSVDRDIDSMTDCMRLFGSVGDIESFAEAVNE